MMYLNQKAKQALKSDQVSVLTKTLLLTALEYDYIEAEKSLELALTLLRGSNREIFSHSARNDILH